jgi:hypothetical protein
MDPVQIRIDAEVADALRKILKLRDQWLAGKDEYKKSLAEMQAVTNNFTGDKLTRTATQFLQVIQKVGGVSQLTAKEQEKVNKVFTEFEQKAILIGRSVPEAMQKVITATSQVALKSQQELNKTTQLLSGEKIIRQADQYVQAVQKIGSVNKLTEAQQAKVNKVLTEAVEAYHKLGITVPADVQKIVDATKKIKPAADDLKKLRDQLSGEASLRSANQYVKVIGEIGGVSKLSAEDQKKLLAILDKLDAQFKALGKDVPPAIKGIHAELTKLKPATDEVKKLADALSGRQITREAGLWVSAVQRIGGVTKLTVTEQQKLNGVLTEAANKYRALGQQVPKDVQTLLSATKTAGQETKNIFQTTWADIAKGSFVGNIAANTLAAAWRLVRTAIREAADAAVDFIARGSQVDRITTAFQKLIPANKEIAASARDTARVTDEMIAAGQRGTEGLATRFEIMRAANQAVLFGLPLTVQQFEVLSRASITLGRAMDLGPGRALNDLIIALGRSSPRILDNLGIIVKLTEANQKYADTHNKNRLELTAEEKTVAFYTESMRKMGIKVKEIGEIHLTAADNFGKAQVKLTDLRDEMARIAAGSPILNKAISGIGDIIVRAFGNDPQQMVQNMYRVINQAAIIIVKAFDFAATAVGTFVGGLTLALAFSIKFRAEQLRVAEAILKTAVAINEGMASIPGLGRLYKDAAEQARKYQKDFKEAFGSSKELDEFADKVVTTGFQVTGRIKGMQIQAKELTAELERMSKVDPFATLKKSAENLPRIVDNDLANAEGDAGKPLTKAQQAQLKREEAFRIAWDKELEKTRKEYNAFVDWYEVAVARWIHASEEYDRKIAETFSDQNTTKVVRHFQQVQGVLAEIDKLHREKGFMTWVDIIKKMGQLSSDPGQDPKKWLKSELIKKAMDTILESTNRLSQAFAQLAQTGTGSFSKLITEIGQFINLLNVGAEAGKTTKIGWDQMGKGLSKLKDGFKANNAEGIGEMIAGMANMTAGVISAIAVLNQATNVAGKFNRALKGAMAGAQIGAQIAGGWGALAGAVIGAFTGLFRHPLWEEAGKRLGREFGHEFTDALKKQIEADAKNLFKGDLQAAEIFNLGNIIKELGGVNDLNFDKLAAKLRDVFVMVQTGKFTVEQARKVLDENFALFKDHIEKTGGLVSDAILEIIRLDGELKTHSEEIRSFLLGNADKLGGALSTMANDTAERYKDVAQNIKKAEEDLTDAQKEEADARKELAKAEEDQRKKIVDLKAGWKGTLEELNEEIEKLLKEKPDTSNLDEAVQHRLDAENKLNGLQRDRKVAASESREEFERLGRITLAAQKAMEAQGLSSEEIAERLGPAWSRLVSIQDNLGISTNNLALADELALQRAKEKNKTIFEGAEAVNTTTAALFNLGGINQETFNDLQSQMQTFFTRLQSTGISQRQVLQQNLPFLRTALELEQRRGIQLDDTTRMYIAQARELGLLTDAQKTDQEIWTDGFTNITDGLRAIIEALHGEVPDSLRKMADEADNQGQQAGEALGTPIQDAAVDTANKVQILTRSLMQVGLTAEDASRQAVSSLGAISQAAIDAANEVTAVAEGHSPGGFRGVSSRSQEALVDVERFANVSRRLIGDLNDTINEANPGFIDNGLIGRIPSPRGPVVYDDIGQLIDQIGVIAKKPGLVIEKGAIQNNLQAWGIAEKEDIENAMARVTMRQILRDARLADEFNFAVEREFARREGR